MTNQRAKEIAEWWKSKEGLQLTREQVNILCQAYLDLLKEMEGKVLVPVVDCPDCPNQGWYTVGNIDTGDAEQEQCQFCYTIPNSRFNIEVMIKAARGSE